MPAALFPLPAMERYLLLHRPVIRYVTSNRFIIRAQPFLFIGICVSACSSLCAAARKGREGTVMNNVSSFPAIKKTVQMSEEEKAARVRVAVERRGTMPANRQSIALEKIATAVTLMVVSGP